MSVLPVQVPTSVFIFSNSAEPCFAWAGSAAFNPTEAARSNVAQYAVIFIFISFLSFCLLVPSFTSTTNGPAHPGQPWPLSFGGVLPPGPPRSLAAMSAQKVPKWRLTEPGELLACLGSICKLLERPSQFPQLPTKATR